MSHYDYPHILGRTWNLLFPKKPIPPMPALQPRDHAIRALFDYLSMIEWRHEGRSGGPPIGFTIPRTRMYEEKVDDNTTLELPCLVVDPKSGSWESEKPMLGPPVVWENTYDGKTVLVELGTYNETFNLEVWTSSAVMRRAILAGLDWAFAPTGDFAGMSFLLPNYYNVWCWYGLGAVTRFDDAQLSSRRRYATAEVSIQTPVVMQVPIGFFEPRVQVVVNNPDAAAGSPRELWDTSVQIDIENEQDESE